MTVKTIRKKEIFNLPGLRKSLKVTLQDLREKTLSLSKSKPDDTSYRRNSSAESI